MNEIRNRQISETDPPRNIFHIPGSTFRYDYTDPGRRGNHTRAKRYPRWFHEHAVPNKRFVPGIREVRILNRLEGEIPCFVTMSYRDSDDAVWGFTGADPGKADNCPEDEDFFPYSSEIICDCLIPRQFHWVP